MLLGISKLLVSNYYRASNLLWLCIQQIYNLIKIENRFPLHQNRFRLFSVSSPLIRKSRLLSFPSATKMFQFTELPTKLLKIQKVYIGFPIWESLDQNLFLVPQSISSVTTPLFDSKCQAIQHKP
jgi:hypothetical protein